MIKPFGFEEFDNVDFSTWMSKVEKDLRGASIESISTRIGDSINYTPFHSGEQRNHVVEANREFLFDSVVTMNFTRPSMANDDILAALSNASDGVIIDADQHADFNKLLKDVLIDCCSVCLQTDDPIQSLIGYTKWLNENGWPLRNTNGLIFSPSNYRVLINDEQLDRLIEEDRPLPNLKFLSVKSDGFDAQDPGERISNLCLALSDLIHLSQNKYGDKIDLTEFTYFEIPLDDDLSTNIATIKTLKFLSSIILKEYGIERSSLPIHVYTNALNGKELVSTTNQTMAALLGGAHSVDVKIPQGFEDQTRAFQNILNILKEESYLDKVANPLEGSFFIENLMEQMINVNWKQFLSKSSINS